MLFALSAATVSGQGYMTAFVGGDWQAVVPCSLYSQLELCLSSARCSCQPGLRDTPSGSCLGLNVARIHLKTTEHVAHQLCLHGHLSFVRLPTGDYEEAEQSGDMVGEDAAVEDAPLTTFDAVTLQLPTVDANFTHMAEDTMQLQLILMAAVPLALLILLVLIVVPFAIYYKRKRAKQGEYLLSTHFQTLACVLMNIQ